MNSTHFVILGIDSSSTLKEYVIDADSGSCSVSLSGGSILSGTPVMTLAGSSFDVTKTKHAGVYAVSLASSGESKTYLFLRDIDKSRETNVASNDLLDIHGSAGS